MGFFYGGNSIWVLSMVFFYAVRGSSSNGDLQAGFRLGIFGEMGVEV